MIIDADQITSTEVDVRAHRRDGKWHVTGWPQPLDRNGAITVITIAEERARPEPDWALIEALEAELR
ncbi:hypothetical protein [Actinomadura sp. NEAU-AAG7]|uniref:hypothetical protein n=1 Tax=Actinomadura sp. NEAU-AAG7 TaxID=2839640 RepID=UPI001BE44B35|nr:hypothetical protein [Actinomadura sp. NEAU-AAG7]MBT2213497.1 hypothetical protein [Actinomadura sp. NEAU-AAG7]